jgi:hypothetical protein
MLYVLSCSGAMCRSWVSIIFRTASFDRVFVVTFIQHPFSPYRISEPQGAALQHLVTVQRNRLDRRRLPGVFVA